MASHGDKYKERDRNSRTNKPVDYPPPCDRCFKSEKCQSECASYRTWEEHGV